MLVLKLIQTRFFEQTLLVFSVFNTGKCFKTQNEIVKEKLETETFTTVPVRASNSKWSSRTVDFKMRLLIWKWAIAHTVG